MRLALGARVTAKMLGYYAEQVAVSSLENPKIWDTFKICMLEEGKNMDSKDSIRILKSIHKISEKLESEHFRDLLKLTYNKIESHILTFPPSDLALISSISAKIGHADKSLLQSLVIAFSTRLVQATSSDILTFVKNLRHLNVDVLIYDEIIKYLCKCHSMIPTSDLISILFCCSDCDIHQLLENIAKKVAKTELSPDNVVKALYLYSINRLPNPLDTAELKSEISYSLLPHLTFSSAIYSIDIRDFRERILDCLGRLSAISKLIVIYSLALNALKSSGKHVFYTFFKKKFSKFHESFLSVFSSFLGKSDDNSILMYLLESIALFANVYAGKDSGDLFRRVLKTLDGNGERTEWAKGIVPHVWLDSDVNIENCNINNTNSKEGNAEEFQNSYLNNLELLHEAASGLELFSEDFPFNISEDSEFNAPFIIPDMKLALEKLGQTAVITHGKKELIVLERICFVPLSPIHFIDGISGLNPEIELPDTIIRQNVRKSLSELSKEYELALIPYWKWSRLNSESEQVDFVKQIIDK